MRVAALLACGLVVSACSGPTPRPAPETPQRIVSLDYCADQFVLRFVEAERIAAISPEATGAFSYMREAAAGHPIVRPTVEDALLLKPDLIVRSYGGGANAEAAFARAGVPVVTLGWAGTVQDALDLTRRTAAALGAREAGEAVAAEAEVRLAELARTARGRSALYMTPGGVTTGPGSLVHELLEAGGFDNYVDAPGWRPLPLERLAGETPDALVTASFDGAPYRSEARHPIARRLADTAPVIALDGAWTACGGWFLIEAVEALAAAP